MTTTRRLALGLLGAGTLVLGLSVPAGAHVSPDVSTVPAGAYTAVTLTVPHGCEDAPTDQVAVQIPEDVLNAAPKVLAGWDVETTMAELPEPIESSHGEPQTERVAEITWTAQPGNELPSAYRQDFTIGFKAPDAEGERLFFKVVQGCTEGETAWIEETAEGDEEPELPAPFVDVVAAEGDGHGGSDDAAAGTDAEDADAEAEEVAAEPVAASSDAGGGGSDGLAVAGLVAGLLGLAAGGVALIRTRAAD